MRKVKKINGYLVVRFNERERRDYPQLGAYGVIDAELYTGNLDADRGEMEYEDAETLETAMEQARGLEGELDVEEPEAVVTVTVATEDGTTRLEITPEELIQKERHFLETQGTPRLRNGPAADWQFQGYIRALADLGIVDSTDERFHVPPKSPESECPTDLAQMYARVHQQSRKVLAALAGGEAKEGFRHLDPALRGAPPVRAAYRLGLALERDCPDNDCRVYRNIFRIARELDTALDGLDEDGAPALYLRKALRERVSELKEMYTENHAVRKYRENQKEPPDKQTAPGHEPPQAAPPCAGACAELKEHLEQMLQNPAPTGELKRAQAALERTIILVQEHAGEDERRKLISDLGTFGRLLERETARPDVTQAQTLARLACGILDGSVHLFPRPEEGGRIQVALLDTIRREEAAQLTFREMGGGYFIETLEDQHKEPR